ncbi:alanine racemase [Aureimonas altamirensis]|uniref:alanine racemase n=1 Tax=Aureimonas altamirensis TaxID=370622 RepID=UPI003EBEBC98
MNGPNVMHSSGSIDISPLAMVGAGTLTIDLAAVRSNYRGLCQAAAGAAVAGVVKADAYGLGAARIAQVLYQEGCRTFFVAQLMEALSLRDGLPGDAELFVLNGVQPELEAECAERRITPVLNSRPQFAAWRALAHRLGRRLPAALQADTGMSRLGLPPEELEAIAADATAFEGLDFTLFMSHLACADEPDNAANAMQLANFRALSALLPAARRSLANSAGIMLGPDFRFDLVRPGIALYGGAPIPGRPNPMKPVATVEAPVAQIRTVPPGAGIGYGFSRHATGRMRLATIPVGYADGWHRASSNRGSAWFEGHALPFAGRVSMDSIILDATAVPALAPGDRVELVGPHRTLDAVAADAGTISYEILTSLGMRFTRVYRDETGKGAVA